MTRRQKTKEKNISTLSALTCLGLAGLMILFSREMKDGVLKGIQFSLFTLIPTLFPFFILSDLWACSFLVNENGVIGRFFKKAFGINPSAASAFLSGLICGFPIGVKTASDLYNAGKITKEEFERLSGFVNNPSIAFIISGVGAGILGDIRLGILLYISTVFSSVATGIIFRRTYHTQAKSSVISRQKFNLVNSIQKAGMTSVVVSSYIIFFSGVIGICSSLIKNEIFLAITSSFLEVGSATMCIKNCAHTCPEIMPILLAFALGFSGLSVHLQAFSFFPEGASKIKYLFMKLIQGMISAIFVFLFSTFFI